MHSYFNVITSPPTTADQRRHQVNWSANWRLFWRCIRRRGRHHEFNRNAPDDIYPTPLDVAYYLGPPGVWASLSTGKTIFGFS